LKVFLGGGKNKHEGHHTTFRDGTDLGFFIEDVMRMGWVPFEWGQDSQGHRSVSFHDEDGESPDLLVRIEVVNEEEKAK
jgi:hypothetical protein